MNLPFSPEQSIEAFVRYNAGVGPAQMPVRIAE
jgi:hypothetical protein